MSWKDHYFKCICKKTTVDFVNFRVDNKQDLFDQIKKYDWAELELVRAYEIFLPKILKFPDEIEKYCKANYLQYEINGDNLHIKDWTVELGLYNYRWKRTTKSTRPRDGKMVLVEDRINYFSLPSSIRQLLSNGKCTQKILDDAFKL